MAGSLGVTTLDLGLVRGVALCPWAKTLYLYVCAPSQPGSEWVPGRTVIGCVFKQFPVSRWQQGLYAPREVELVLE